MTTLKDLQAIAAPLRELVKKEITYKIGNDQFTATVFVVPLTVKSYEEYFLSKDADTNRLAKTINIGIRVGEKGNEPIPVKLAEELPPALAGAMVEAFNEVNVPKKS